MKKKTNKAQSGKVITGDPLYDNLLNKRDSIIQRPGGGAGVYKEWDFFLKKGIEKIKAQKAQELRKSIDSLKVIEDDMGQLKHPGKPTKINSNKITMQGVPYPVLGISDIGDTKLMFPNQEYNFDGNSVTELPLGKSGIHIKPENKGKFNALKKKTGKTTEELTHSKNPLTRKRAIFAQNAAKWNKGQTGIQIPFDPNANMGNIPPIETNWGSENIYAPGQFSTQGQLSQFNSTLSKPQGFLGKVGEQLGGPMGMSNTATSLIGGIQQIKQDKEAKRTAKQAYRLSKVVKQAAELDPENVKRKYHRPEDQIFNPNEIGSPTGVGTNYLAEHGATIEYVPLDKTDVKQFQFGGFMAGGAGAAGGQGGGMFGNIMGGMGGQAGGIGSMLGSAIGGGKGAPSGASQVGTTIGGTIGNLFGPVGNAIGSFAGGLIGGAIGGKGQKQTARYTKRANNNLMSAAFTQGVGSLRNQYTGFMKDGGKLAMGGDLETYWGGGATPMSENPYLPDGGQTVMFNGASHENGGIGVKFGGTKVEVEGGEPAVKLKDEKGKDNLTVFGNMKIPPFGVLELNDPKAKGKKFKNYVADLSRTEAKQNNIVDKNLKMVSELDVATPYDKLTLSAGHAMLEGANMKLKNIAQKKQTASMVQNAILETADELGIESDALAKGNIKKAKHGAMIAQDGKRISRAEVEEYLKQGYQPDPDNTNRLFKKSSIPGETKTINISEPGKGSEEFNRAFANARKQKLGEFVFKGKKYTTDLFNSKTKTVTTPGKESVDYIDIYDPEARPENKFTPSGTPSFNLEGKTDKTGLNWMDVVNTALPYLRPSNQLDLDPNQLAGERYALATNQLDPVQAQLYHPLLENVSDISLQDQLNANQADFNAIQRSVGANPAALASLAAQKYQANTGVLGEQFRHNQAQKQGVFNRNRGTLNDAQLKNLSILDQQYVRQSQAKSNTKATAQAALNSISDKIAKNKLENKTLGIYENLYNYRFGPKGYAYNLNPLAEFQFPSAGDTGLQYLDNLVAPGKEPEFNSRGQLKDVGSKAKNRNGSIVKAIKNL